MGMLTLKLQSSTQVPAPGADQLRLFVDVDSILKTKDSFGNVRPTGVGTADDLATTGAPVDVSASPPPVAGQVLVATGPSSAVWSAVAAGQLMTSGAPVTVSTSPPPGVGYVLTATNATNAVWQAAQAGGLRPTTVQVPGTSYVAQAGDLVLCDVTADSLAIVLPASHAAGQQVGIKMVSTANGNEIDVEVGSAESIDGATFLALDTDYEWAILISDGTNWLQIG